MTKVIPLIALVEITTTSIKAIIKRFRIVPTLSLPTFRHVRRIVETICALTLFNAILFRYFTQTSID